jgi:hypothetical protein
MPMAGRGPVSTWPSNFILDTRDRLAYSAPMAMGLIIGAIDAAARPDAPCGLAALTFLRRQIPPAARSARGPDLPDQTKAKRDWRTDRVMALAALQHIKQASARSVNCSIPLSLLGNLCQRLKHRTDGWDIQRRGEGPAASQVRIKKHTGEGPWEAA